jgi:opacity protein-like surface antigen
VRHSTGIHAALAASLLLGAAEARAQAVQVTPFAGFAFGGSLRDTVLDQDASFEAGLDYGGTLSFRLSGGFRFELLYSRQETELGGPLLGVPFDVTIERYMAGLQEEKGEGSVRYFGSFLVGATRLVPGVTGLEAETRFGLGVGLGVKSFFTKNVGLRLEVRGFYTLVESEGGAFCTDGSCLFAFTGSGLWQGDLSGGLILRF